MRRKVLCPKTFRGRPIPLFPTALPPATDPDPDDQTVIVRAREKGRNNTVFRLILNLINFFIASGLQLYVYYYVCVNSAVTAARSNYNATHGFADAIFVPIYNGGRHGTLNEPNGKFVNSIEHFAATAYNVTSGSGVTFSAERLIKFNC